MVTPLAAWEGEAAREALGFLMRRSRAPLSAWPAFADVMTILAVVSLAVAAVALGRGDPEVVETLKKKIVVLTGELKQANETIRERDTRIQELELQIKFRGGVPCLWAPGPPITVVPLVQITVAAQDAVSFLPRSLDGNPEIRSIPGLENAVEQGQMSVQEFELYANPIYQYGMKVNTFGGSCRFYVELKQGSDDPLAFSRASGFVEKYFLFSNSAEVSGIRRGEQ